MRTKLLFLAVLFISFYSCVNTQNSAKQDDTNADAQNANVVPQQTTKVESLLDRLGLEEVECSTETNWINYSGAPHVMMKFKYISSKPVDSSISVDGVYIDNKTKEVKDRAVDYLNKISLQSGMINEINLSYGEPYWCNDDISCQIYLNGELYKTVKTPPEPC